MRLSMEVEVILVPRYNRPLPEQIGADVEHGYRSQETELPSRGIELALEVVFVLRPLATETAVTDTCTTHLETTRYLHSVLFRHAR